MSKTRALTGRSEGIAAWWLRLKGYEPDQIVLAGDSAGGYLSLALAERLQREGLKGEVPAAMVTMSPLFEIDNETRANHPNIRSDVMFPAKAFTALVELIEAAAERNAVDGKAAAIPGAAIVDLVTTRTPNLYRDLLEQLGQADPTLGDEPPPTYAASCRWARPDDAWVLETWAHPLAVRRPLPTLPLWLAADRAVPLELERSYEETCRILRIG